MKLTFFVTNLLVEKPLSMSLDSRIFSNHLAWRVECGCSEAFAEKLAPLAEVMAEETDRRIQLLGGCVERLSDQHRALLHKRYGKETSITTLSEDHGKTASAMKPSGSAAL